MNFLFLGIFFQIFSEFISILNNKNELKNDKKLFIFRVGPMWMRRGTQGHMAAPRGPTRRIYIFIIIYIVYNGYSAFLISKGFSNLLNRRVL